MFLDDRYACGHQRVSGQVTMCGAAVMAASTLRLSSILALTVLVVPVSPAEDHEWHFDPGRVKNSVGILCFSPFKRTVKRLFTSKKKHKPFSLLFASRATPPPPTFISLRRHSPHILRSGRLILHQPSTGYPMSSAPVCQPVMCNKRMRRNLPPPSSHPLHLSSPFSAARQDR